MVAAEDAPQDESARTPAPRREPPDPPPERGTPHRPTGCVSSAPDAAAAGLAPPTATAPAPAGAGQGEGSHAAGDIGASRAPQVSWQAGLAGAAFAVAATGAVLVLADLPSPLRAPFALFFLLVAPAGGLAALLLRLDPLSRAVLALLGAAVLDLLVAQAMLVAQVWTARGGTAVVAVLSLLLLGLAAVRELRRARLGGRES